jgi:hypothetical protein
MRAELPGLGGMLLGIRLELDGTFSIASISANKSGAEFAASSNFRRRWDQQPIGMRSAPCRNKMS